jgi:aminopeptidase N
LAAILGLASCTQNTSVSSPPKRRVANVLEKTYAEYRASVIKNVKYKLVIKLTEPDYYGGVVTVDFNLDAPKDISLDFFEGENLAVKANGQTVDVSKYNKFFIELPADKLKAGSNTVSVIFTHAYNKTGSGLYRFVDPEDHRAYLYTDFEPFDAHVFMPCFDQPDLKATYTLNVVAPKEWEVVSSTLGVKTAAGDANAWQFPETAKFATYLFSLHAGPYKVWSNEIVTKNHKIPHRVMARQSLAKYVDVKEWNTNIQNGFEFYEEYFDFPYPFAKYDEVIVPDFNSGAMENVAAVTFNENRYISRSQKTRAAKRQLASVQLHELAHMWFGDLVTMKWWNDIWLNESFATYAAFRALDANTEYKEAGLDFLAKSKHSAYTEDRLVTTHPIEFEVPDTDVVFANFDGITYGKGASVLKQLNFYLTDEKFRDGVRDYFKKYQFSNATLDDFTGALEGSSGKSLAEWKKVWLKTAQVNTVKVDYTCENGQTRDSMILQTAPKGYETLRPHKSQIGVFTFENNKFKLMKTVDVTFSGQSTQVIGLDGIDCDKIALIYPNYMDHDYALVDLDKKSLETLMTKISSIDDDMLKVALWSTLWDMVETQKIPATQVFDIILAHADKEKNPDVLGANIGRAFTVAHQYLAKDDKMKEQREKSIARLSEYFLKNAQKAATVDLQKLWFGSFVENADTPKDLDMILGFLKKAPKWLKFPIDQDRRWGLVQQLAQKGYKNYAELIEEEKKRDHSARAEKALLASQARCPSSK